MSLRDILRAALQGVPARNVPDRDHPGLGTPVWDAEVGYWILVQRVSGRPIRVALWGDAKRGPSPLAVAMFSPLVADLERHVREATMYLASALSQEARHVVLPVSLTFDGISVYAGKYPSVEVDFEWPEKPDWLLRVTLQDGRPIGWGRDD